MADREMFLQALSAEEDNEDLRLAYADWLEEQGEYEEAERQRAWPDAKAWLVALCNSHTYENGINYMTYERLRDFGDDALLTGDANLYFGSAEEIMWQAQENQETFWKNLSIVTGLPIPDHIAQEGGHFSCAC